VRVAITDYKLPLTEDPTTQTRGLAPFIVDERAVNDYYPYGMLIPERSYSSNDYRYGYNTQEKSLEIDANGNHTTAEFWEYDARRAGRWNRDPVIKPIRSDYSVFSSNPITNSDLFGDEDVSKIYPQSSEKCEEAGRQFVQESLTEYYKLRNEYPRSFLFGEGLLQASAGVVESVGVLAAAETGIGALWGAARGTSAVYNVFAGTSRSFVAVLGTDSQVKDCPTLSGNSLPGMIVGATTGSQDAANISDVYLTLLGNPKVLPLVTNKIGISNNTIFSTKNDIGYWGIIGDVSDGYLYFQTVVEKLTIAPLKSNLTYNMSFIMQSSTAIKQPSVKTLSGSIISTKAIGIPTLIKIEDTVTQPGTNKAAKTSSSSKSGAKPRCNKGA
jgi:hypothetical protein